MLPPFAEGREAREDLCQSGVLQFLVSISLSLCLRAGNSDEGSVANNTGSVVPVVDLASGAMYSARDDWSLPVIGASSSPLYGYTPPSQLLLRSDVPVPDVADLASGHQHQHQHQHQHHHHHHHSSRSRCEALHMLTCLWALFPAAIEGDDTPESTAENILMVLKRCSRRSSGQGQGQLSTQMFSLTCLFQLLDSLAIAHSAYAPYVYKTLIFTFIETRGHAFVGDFIMHNMCLTLTRCDGLVRWCGVDNTVVVCVW